MRDETVNITNSPACRQAGFVPQELKIAGIPTFIVDPHHHVFPFWHKLAQGKELALLHIDKHSDLASLVRPLSYAQARKRNIEHYVIYHLGIGSFIISARHEKIIGPIYWTDLRMKDAQNGRLLVRAYGRADDSASFAQTNSNERGWLEWCPDFDKIGSRFSQSLTSQDVKPDLSSYKSGFILDIDLDALCDRSDPVKLKSLIEERLSLLQGLLSGLPQPHLITIARSECPIRFTPKKFVDFIQDSLLERLENLFGKRAYL